VADEVKVGRRAVLANCVVGEGSFIGDGSHIPPGSVLGDRVKVMPGSRLPPGSVIWPDTVVDIK